jgi:Lamin Tail Domain/Secretion system C-terminal sorting domain
MRTEESMRNILLFFLIIISLGSRQVFPQKANHVVIAEIYGSGGNTGATYKSDYIVLYNPTASSVDLSAWSVQYQSGAATGGFSAKTNLKESISSNGYYLIAENTSTGGANLPHTPRVTGTINLNATSGKVALVKSQSLISGILDANTVDYVGYGSANDYEGSGTAVSPSATKSICRKDNSGHSTYGSNGSGWDSDNNSADFYLNTAPAPLPVELSYFESIVAGNKVHLRWKTDTEINNFGFEIERSSSNDGYEKWERVGFAAGNGNCDSPREYFFTDLPSGGKEFRYRLKQIDFSGVTEYSKDIEAVLGELGDFRLGQNYPNPSNPSTRISYTIPEKTLVKLRVYDILAREVEVLVNKEQAAGIYEVSLDGNSLGSGTYFYKLEAGGFTEVKKLVLVK